MAYGKLKVDKIETTAEELTLPTSAGSAGQVLTSDGSGVLSFQDNATGCDLTATANGSSLTVESSSGANVALPAASSTAWGVMSDEDKAKLDLIEASSTADQTGAEIKAAYEAESDTNAFTDADHSKLDAIEASATADQTDAEIRAAVEAATDSNVFTDADHTKLDGLTSLDLLDEDDFATDSATKAASQQSIKAYVDTEVAGLVDSSPASLDTLNELAAALGDDANYAATITTSLGLKAPKASPAFTGDATCTGTISDAKGDVRTIPASSSTTNVLPADAGKFIPISAGIILDTNTAFTAGQAVTIYNDQAASNDETITATGITLYLATDPAASGNRTLAARGLATILCTATNVYVISGAGVS